MSVKPRYIVFEQDVPVLMRFSDSYVINKEILDSVSGRLKNVDTIQLVTTHLNGKPVDAEWSVLSWKAIQRIQPYIDNGQIKTKTFKVTKHGKGFHTKYEIEVL